MIVRHDTLPRFELPGLEHRTLAGHQLHQTVNSGSAPLVLLAALRAAPVRVRTDTGEPLPLPWAAP
ncbi:MAG TPA: hypothetical protein VLC53_06540 [Myxococcota bacterium]|nr:hypothetical protein [Myxococcota bacterium]